MECAPASIEDVLYTWLVFFVIATFSLLSAEVVALKYATDVGRSAFKRIPLPRIRAFNVTLVAFMMVTFYATILLVSIMVHAILTFLHIAVESLFRTDRTWLEIRWVRIGLHIMDNYMDPGLLFGFMSPRLWKLHLGVLLAVLLAAVVHTILFVSPARIRALGGWGDAQGEEGSRPGERGPPTVAEAAAREGGRGYRTIFPVAWYGRRAGMSVASPLGPGGGTRRQLLPDPYLVQRLFSDTSSTVVTVLILLYTVIVVREVVIVIAQKE